MGINIIIDPTSYEAGGPLADFAFKEVPNVYPKLSGPALSAASAGYIASAPRLTGSSNILEDGTFPVAQGATGEFLPPDPVSTIDFLIVHVAPTSGSSIVRGGTNWNPAQAEFDPAYGLDVGIAGVDLQEDVFETAINEPIGAQFKANLQDYVSRGILIVSDTGGTPMTPGDIGSYTAP
jgi:hypothetical protein